MSLKLRSVLRSPLLWLALVAAAIAVAWFMTQRLAPPPLPEGIAAGNGRLEAVSIDVASPTGGRVMTMTVEEGDAVVANQVLARMDTDSLEAQRREAQAQLRSRQISRDAAESGVKQAEADHAATQAQVAQRQTEVEAAQRRLARSEQLIGHKAISRQELDDDRARVNGAQAALDAARAQVAAAEARIATAQAQVVDAEAGIAAAAAAIERIDTQINDSILRAPRAGRVQYRVAQPGEVVPAGGRVLNMIDLSDVYMTIFLPTSAAGRLAIGDEARLLLDAAPNHPIPGEVSFLSDVAQFTPRAVETTEERQDLMFRVRVRVPPELLERYAEYVKPGLPGMAYVRTHPNAVWPDWLQAGLMQ